jgi:hypothetical protein
VCNPTKVENFLRSLLSLGPSIAIAIKSIAISHDQNTQVATFALTDIPSGLSPSSIGPEDDWSFDYNMPPAYSDGSTEGTTLQCCNITIDTHFRGLTILSSPQNPTDHRIE